MHMRSRGQAAGRKPVVPAGGHMTVTSCSLPAELVTSVSARDAAGECGGWLTHRE